MSKVARNLHVPLPEELYVELRTASEKTGRPATEIAREAISRWIDEQRRATRRAEIAAYAAANCGTEVDLDRDLERAAVAHLRGTARPKKRAK